MKSKFIDINNELTLDEKIELLKNNIRYINKKELEEIEKKELEEIEEKGIDIRCSDVSRIAFDHFKYSQDYTHRYYTVYTELEYKDFSNPEKSRIAIPYSILKSIFPVSLDHATFGYFPTKCRDYDPFNHIHKDQDGIYHSNDKYYFHFDDGYLDNDISTNEYNINGVDFKVAHNKKPIAIYVVEMSDSLPIPYYGKLDRPKTLPYEDYRYFYLEPIEWDIYPELDLAVTHKVLVNKKLNPKDYLQTDFLNSILDKETLNIMKSYDKKAHTINDIKVLANKINKPFIAKRIDRLVDEYNKKLDSVKKNVESDTLVLEDENTIEMNFILTLNTIESNIEAYIKYVDEFDKAINTIHKFNEETISPFKITGANILYPNFKDELAKDLSNIKAYSLYLISYNNIIDSAPKGASIKFLRKEILKYKDINTGIDINVLLNNHLNNLKTYVDYAEEYIQFTGILRLTQPYDINDILKDYHDSLRDTYKDDDLFKDICNLELNILPRVYDNNDISKLWYAIKDNEIKKCTDMLENSKDINNISIEPKTLDELKMDFRVKMHEFLIKLCLFMNGTDIMNDNINNEIITDKFNKEQNNVITNYKNTILNVISIVKEKALPNEYLEIDKLEKLLNSLDGNAEEIMKNYNNILMELYKIEYKINFRMDRIENIENKKVR